jgi:alkylation response protein AidB-like acyl-CoA dehydrogenase
MNFLLSEQQGEMQRSVERYLAERCPPQRLHALFDADAPFDPGLWQGLCELGIAGVMLPQEHGGLGLELIDLALMAETLGRAAAPGPWLGHELGGLAIALAGSEEQRARWLPQLATGEKLATIAFGEGDGAWLPEQWRLDGAATLTGSKQFVPCGAVADLVVVGLAGGRLGVVEGGAPGLDASAHAAIDRTRRLYALKFEGTPVEPLPGDAAERVRDAALVLLAADAFGGATRCIDMAVEYAKLREQFGGPIGRFQGLKHQIVNCAIDVEPARGLYWYAAHAWDHIPQAAACSAALAKTHLCERYLQAARDMVEAHGGIGYTWEHDLQIYFKRAMFDHAWCGAPTLHRERVAALAGW